MAERSTLGLAHQLLDLLRENQEQEVSLEHARLLVNLARALVRPQDAQEDISGDYETGIALDIPGAAADAPSSPALVKTAEPESRSDIFNAAVTPAALVKTPEPRENEHGMDTLEVAAPTHSSLEHLDASTRSTYQPSAIVNTKNDDSSASSNTTLSINRTLNDSGAQDAPLPTPDAVVSTMLALVQPLKSAVSVDLEPNVVPALYSGHQHIPAAPGAASSTTVSPRSRDDAAHTKTELTESATLPPAIPLTELSPMTKEEDTPILLLAKYPPPLPLHTNERASASPSAWVKTEPVDSPVLSSLPIGPGDETNASALPIPNCTYPPPSEVYQTHVKIEPVDSPALFSPTSIASVRRSLVSTTEEDDSPTPPFVPLENATARRVLVKTEPIAEDALAAMQVPSAQRNGGLHWPSSTASCVIYHHSHTPPFQHAPAKAEPLDAFIPAIQPSPKDAGDSDEHLPTSMPASALVKAEHEDADLAHEQEPLSSLVPTAGATPPLVKAEPVEPSIGIPSTDEADTPILRLAKYVPAPAPTPVNDGDVHTTHMPSVHSSLVTAASSNAANHSLPGQTVLEILSAPATLKSSPSSGATSDMHIVQPLPRTVHVESEALVTTSVPSVPEDAHDERQASIAPSSSSNADAVGIANNPTSTRSPSPSACSTAAPNAAPPSHTSNSPATSAAGYADVFMLAAWSDDETSPVNAQPQDIFPHVPPPTPASLLPTSGSPSPNVPRSLSPSHAAPVLPLQTDIPTTAEASDEAYAPMDIDEGAAPRAHEGEGTETEEQEQRQNVPRLLLRMSSPVPVPTQAQRDDAKRADGPAHDAPSSEVEYLDADGRAEAEEAYVPSLLRRMSGPRHDSNTCATEQQDEVEDDSAPSTSNIFSRLGDVQTYMLESASLRSRFDTPPLPLPLAERISPPSSVRAEHHGHSNFKRRYREGEMEDGGSAVGKRRRRK